VSLKIAALENCKLSIRMKSILSKVLSKLYSALITVQQKVERDFIFFQL
jgi:hypothetical protein